MILPRIEAARLANPAISRLISEAPRRPMLCDADGLLVVIHPRCRDCGVLLGPCHPDPASEDSLCGSCRE